MRWKAVVVFDFEDDDLPGMSEQDLANAVQLVLFGTVDNDFQNIGVEVFPL